jgi:lysophospholipase L1-like esterase
MNIRSMLFFTILVMSVNITAQIKVACIGNSITSGYSNTGISYVPKLQALLGSVYLVENEGVSGTTLLKNGNNSYWINGRLNQALAFKANIITIKLGTNDTKPQNWNQYSSEFKKDYESLIDTLNSLNVKPKIYLVTPVPVFYNASTVSWGIRDSIVKKIIPIIKEIAAERGLTVIDVNTPLLPFSNYFSVDGIHPNAAAADTIAQVIYRSIKPTAVIPTQVYTLYNRAGALTRVYPVFNGCNMSAIFAEIKQGSLYELSMFTSNGSLLSKASIDASLSSQSSVRKMIANTTAMKWIVLKEHLNK